MADTCASGVQLTGRNDGVICRGADCLHRRGLQHGAIAAAQMAPLFRQKRPAIKGRTIDVICNPKRINKGHRGRDVKILRDDQVDCFSRHFSYPFLRIPA